MTVSEIARRVLRDASDKELAFSVRQLQHWIDKGVFAALSIGNVEAGKGKHRAFDEAALPFVALAVELGKWRLPAEYIHSVVMVLSVPEIRAKALDQRSLGLWADAQHGEPAVLVVQLTGDANRSFTLHVVTPEHLAEYLHQPRHASAVVISLTALFTCIRD